MTKKEAIEKAYRATKFDWDEYGKFVDGFGRVQLHPDFRLLGYETIDEFKKDFMFLPSALDENGKIWMHIPKTLLGIDTNNGWTKIQTKLDLPPEPGFYMTIPRVDPSWTNNSSWFNPATNHLKEQKRWIEQYSHWRVIPVIKPPLY